MANGSFKVGQVYTGEEIKSALGPGSYMQVVVLSNAKEVLCIRFRADMNPNWQSKGELWIHQGDRRIPDAQRWIDSKASVPVFCGKNRSNNWTYLGSASASLLAAEGAAVRYTGDEKVGLVLQMKFDPTRAASTKLIRRNQGAAVSNGKKSA